jgi:integrase
VTRSDLGSITDLSDGRWRIRVSGGYDPVTGHRRRLDRTIRGSARDAAKARAAMLIEVGDIPSAKGLTLAAFFAEMYLPNLERRRAQGKVRRRTIDGYRSKWNLHIEPHIGAVTLDRLDPYRLDRWLGQLTASGVKRHTAHHAYRVLHAALAQAIRWRVLASNPLSGVEDPGVPAHDPTALSAGDANLLLDGFSGHALEPIVALALGAGLRRSELAALTWADIDMKAGTVTVSRGMHQVGQEVFFEQPKTTRSARVVSLPDWTLCVLRPLRGVGPIVVEGGAAMKPNRMSALFASRVRAGLPAVTLRDLRHTHATLALAAGVDVVVVSRRLGHSTVATSDRFYLRPGRAADDDAARKMDGIRSTQRGTTPRSTQRGTRERGGTRPAAGE